MNLIFRFFKSDFCFYNSCDRCHDLDLVKIPIDLQRARYFGWHSKSEYDFISQCNYYYLYYYFLFLIFLCNLVLFDDLYIIDGWLLILRNLRNTKFDARSRYATTPPNYGKIIKKIPFLYYCKITY